MFPVKACVSLLVAACTVLLARAQAPNIVLIVADDLGWSDLSCTGSDFYETPNIDGLAAQGMRFTNAYAAAANCAPSRAALLSGLYAPRTGVYTVASAHRGKPAERALNCPENNTELDPRFVTIAEALREAGYVTGMFGKWHLGTGPTGPEAQGFEVNIAGGRAGAPKSYFSPYGNPQIEDGPDGEHLTERIGREAAGFVRAHADEQFFLYVPFYAVHTPIQPPKDRLEHFKDKQPGTVHTHARYAALVAAMDAAVAQVLAAIDETDMTERTIVLFTSDNGGFGGTTSNAPLRGAKGMFYEGGIRVPLIVRWPGKIEGGALNDVPVTGVDFYPTLLEIAGVPNSGDAHLDGVSFAPALRGESFNPERAIFWHFPAYLESGGVVEGPWRTTPVSVIRQGQYKVLEYLEDGRVELYDLAEDLSETRDLGRELPDVRDRLLTRLHDWRESTSAAMPTGPNPEYAGRPISPSRSGGENP